VNLRKGGTTHPFLTLQFLTDGSYEPDTAAFVVGDGSTRCYVATDGLHNAAYRGLGAERVVAACAAAGLGYDPGPGRGVVFHMLSGLRVGGRLGLTAIGRDPGDAEALYAATVEMLDDLARVTPA
jgi:hypothetical protein